MPLCCHLKDGFETKQLQCDKTRQQCLAFVMFLWLQIQWWAALSLDAGMSPFFETRPVTMPSIDQSPWQRSDLKHGGHLGCVEVGSMTAGCRQSYPKGPSSLRQEKLRMGRVNSFILPRALKCSKIWMESLPGGETADFLLERWQYQGTEICVPLVMALKRGAVGEGRKWAFLILHLSPLSFMVMIPCVHGGPWTGAPELWQLLASGWAAVVWFLFIAAPSLSLFCLGPVTSVREGMMECRNNRGNGS